MFLTAETLDDLMNDLLTILLKGPFDVKTRRGTFSEVVGILLDLKNPRARLSRTETKGKPFSALGELLWYLAKTNELEFIKYYIPQYSKYTDDEKTIYGGYGPRFFNLRGKHDQISNVIGLLNSQKTSRKAVIQLFDGEDIIEEHKDVPCTCTLQFFIRNNQLHMFTSMRSNDAFIGLPHDIFAFTMLQEIMARTLNVEIGTYRHAVGSLHLYEDDMDDAKQYLKEGLQSTKNIMPEMPIGDPWIGIKDLLKVEAKIRNSSDVKKSELDIGPYWSDLARLLKIYSAIKHKNIKLAREIQAEMQCPIYNTYIEKRLVNL